MISHQLKLHKRLSEIVASIETLAIDLEDSARSNQRISKLGSPVTSMAEDAELGVVAKEQTRIARRLRKILQ